MAVELNGSKEPGLRPEPAGRGWPLWKRVCTLGLVLLMGPFHKLSTIFWKGDHNTWNRLTVHYSELSA
jgi:hypothetical protein